MTSDKGRKSSPPYVSYRTFHNFLDGLQQGIPARIDRSYWGDRWSGSTGIQLMAALRFLGLTDNNGMPTPKLRQLASAKSAQKAELLKQITYEAFGPVLQQGAFDLGEATYSQLEEAFHNTYQLTGDVSRKCIKFFLLLAGDAGVPLSSFVVRRLRKSRTVHDGIGTKRNTKKIGTRTNQNALIPQAMDEIPEQLSWSKMVLSKFPTFDPGWSEELQKKWFDAFDKLLQRGFVDATDGK